MEEFVDEQGKYETIQLAKKPVLEAEVEHINALTELVKDGDIDAELLILAMYLEHSGDKATFVKHGIALGPYVDMALKAVTDRQLDVTSAIEKVVDQVPAPPKEKPPKHKPGEIRVEMTTENERGVKVPNWVVRDDSEIHSWHPDPDSAVEALELKLSGNEPPKPPIDSPPPVEHVHGPETHTHDEIPSSDAEAEDTAETELSDHPHRQDVG